MPPLMRSLAFALVVTQLPGCIGWREPLLEQSKQAARSGPSENAARNRAAIQRLLQPTTPAPPPADEPTETLPTSPPSMPRGQERSIIIVPSAPTVSSSRPTDTA